MTKKIAEISGWYGAAAIVGSYALVSFNIIAPTDLIYQLLNLSGALGIMALSIVKGVKQSVVLNAFWAMIAAVAIIRSLST